MKWEIRMHERRDEGWKMEGNKSKLSFPTAANLRFYEAWNKPSLHMLIRKTLERKNVDGHVMTMQFTIHAYTYGFCHSNDNVTTITSK